MNDLQMSQQQMVAGEIGADLPEENVEYTPSVEQSETDDALLNVAIRAFRDYAGIKKPKVCEKFCRVLLEDEYDTWTVLLSDAEGHTLATVSVVGDDAEVLELHGTERWMA